MKTSQTPERWFDWPAALLLLAAMLTAATRLVATHWTDHLSIAQTVVFFGVFAGFALGQSRFTARQAFYFAFGYGVFMIGWQLGTTIGESIPWLERLSVMGTRVGVIIYQVIKKETVQDSFLFLVLMFILFWVLSVHAGFTLVRHGEAWRATLPTGLAMFIIHTFDPLIARRAWYLALYLLITLIVVARMEFIQRQRVWQENRTALPPHLSLDFIRFTVLTASIIVIFAWSAPALAKALPAAQDLWSPVRRTWTETVSNFNNAFASLRSVQPAYSQVYGNNAVLGHGAELTNAQVFIARVPISMPTEVRLYWQAHVYDTYEDGLWRSTLATTHEFDPKAEELPFAPSIGRWTGSFEVVSSIPMATLYTPSQPTWISRPGQIDYVENPNQTVDIFTFRASPVVQTGQLYRIRAAVSHPTIVQLRQAGEEYPAWITDHYLQLPTDITPRTRQLAEFITDGQETTYDKVVAVTEYLRRNITYTPTIEENPPQGQEVIDWFLFDLKHGFCNYYATAEVVLLRSLGIPVRWSIGYAQGESVETEALRGAGADQLTYIIRHKDSHAWPEVYFPTIGWVEFEPTASQPDIVRPADSPETDLSFPAPLNPEDLGENLPTPDPRRDLSAAESGQNPMRVVYWLLGIGAGIGLILLAGIRLLPFLGLPPASVLLERALTRIGIQPPAVVKRWARQAEKDVSSRGPRLPLPVLIERAVAKTGIRPPHIIRLWAQRAMLPPLVKAYMEINRALGRLGEHPAANATPAERGVALGKSLPPAEAPAQRLVAEYQIETFGRRLADLPVAQRSAAEIRRLSLRLYWRRLLERVQRPQPFSRNP
jgi:transglutaminase-like putative cysteine protease